MYKTKYWQIVTSDTTGDTHISFLRSSVVYDPAEPNDFYVFLSDYQLVTKD